jgi:polyisoprenoid-binding protein YceI
MRLISLLALAISISSCSIAQQYTIDNGHTAITSKVMRFDVVKVVGRFNTVTGTINYNATDPTKTTAEITIASESYSANNPEGENAIKSAAFLDVKKYPEIKLVTKSLTKLDAGYNVTAELTLHGITKTITFPVIISGPSIDLPTQKLSIGIQGVFTINRQDFGITMAAKLPSGGMVVGNEVEIGINALALAK